MPDPSRAGLNIIINPDLLFVSDERNRSLIIELKSGSYNEHVLDQLSRLTTLNSHDLVRYGRVTLPHASAVLTHLISILLVINHEHLEGFKTELATVEGFCLASISAELIQTQAGTLSDSALNAEFRTGIAIHQKYLPTRLVRILPTTNVTKDLKRYIVDTVKYFWVNSERTVNPLILARRIFENGVWELFDADAQARFVKVANELLKDMRETEFQRYIQRVPGVQHEWKLVRVPESHDKHRLRALQSFQRAVDQYKTRLENDVPYLNRHHDQMTIDEIEGYRPSDNDP